MKESTPHIVQYQGSKRILAPQILQYIPQRFNRLIEPFAGMAAVTIAVAKSARTDSFLINDINQPLLEILQSAIETPEELVSSYTKVWNDQFSFEGGSIYHFYKIRDEFNAGNKSPAYMLYLLARCVKGSVRYGSNGQFNQSPDKRRYGTSPKTLKNNVFAISYYLKNKTEYMSADYKEVLEKAVPGDIIYMDPPYKAGYEQPVLEALAASRILTPDTQVIIEADLHNRLDFIDNSGFHIVRNKTYKTNQHYFLQID